MQQFNKLKSSINQYGKVFVGAEIIPTPSIPAPDYSVAELQFLKIVSWLYMHYYENGAVSIRFLLEKCEELGVEGFSDAVSHFKIVHSLRTELQHLLDYTSEYPMHNGRWYARCCNVSIPRSDEQWEQCNKTLLAEAKIFFEVIHNCLSRIDRSSLKENFLAEWRLKLDRYIPPHKIDCEILRIANDMGCESVDALKVRRVNLDKWKKELSLLSFDADIMMELRSMIEHTLITDVFQRLPITGHDIIREFEISPGPQVKDLLEMATHKYQEKRMSKKNLLDWLKGKVESA